MEIPPPSKRYARAVVHALGGRVISRQEELQQRAALRMTGFRVLCGIIWAVLAIGLGAGGVGELTIGQVGGAVLCFIIAVPAAWYDYRIWALKARRLFLII